MREEIRRAIISLATARINGRAPSRIYSYDRGQHSVMSEGYDFEAGAHFSDCYHYGTGTHFHLDITARQFDGYDYGAGHHFGGSVNGVRWKYMITATVVTISIPSSSALQTLVGQP